MSKYDSDSIDQRHVTLDGEELAAPEALARLVLHNPEIPELRESARLFVSASPAMVEGVAQWLYARDVLFADGWDAEAWLHLVMRATVHPYPNLRQPPEPIVAEALFATDLDAAEQAAEAFAALENPNVGQARHAELAVLAISRHHEPPARFDALLTLKTAWPYAREILTALPPERRATALADLLGEPFNRTNAVWRVRQALMFQDLMDEETRALLEQRIRAIASMPDTSDDGDPTSELLDRFRAGFSIPESERREEDGLTPDARHALEYWVEKLGASRLAGELGPLAESRSDRSVTVDAPELASLDAWRGAGEERQMEIGQAVARACTEYELAFVGLQTYDGHSIAVFEQAETEMRLSLVPGGSYVRGLSEREEGIVVQAGENDSDADNWYETYQFLIDQAPSMRPTARVTVGPFLIHQWSSEPREPAEVTAMLEDLPFRLPTEAEHEWAMRGGHESQLTWRGDEVPDEEWIEAVMDDPDALANPFGLRGLGLAPEALTDVWQPGYEGAPLDGTARRGDGPRVVRGGAEMLYPWQECGEWQLLSNAVRTSSDDWEYFLSIRPALGVRCQRG